jgi:hypothetical protein
MTWSATRNSHNCSPAREVESGSFSQSCSTASGIYDGVDVDDGHVDGARSEAPASNGATTHEAAMADGCAVHIPTPRYTKLQIKCLWNRPALRMHVTTTRRQ